MKLRDKDQELANAATQEEFDDVLDRQFAEFSKAEGKPEGDELYLYYARRAGYIAGRLRILLWQTKFDDGSMYYEEIEG